MPTVGWEEQDLGCEMGSYLAPGFPRLEQSGKDALGEDGPLLAGFPKRKLSEWSDQTSPLVRRLQAEAETGDWPSSGDRCPGRGPGI